MQNKERCLKALCLFPEEIGCDSVELLETIGKTKIDDSMIFEAFCSINDSSTKVLWATTELI